MFFVDCAILGEFVNFSDFVFFICGMEGREFFYEFCEVLVRKYMLNCSLVVSGVFYILVVVVFVDVIVIL